MSDVFISYARSSEKQAKQIEETLRDAGFGVWRDAELPAHRTYADVIEERLKSAKAVVVLWSAEAAKSQWVRAEADMAREAGTLVQASVDGTIPPIPFNQIQCAELNGWIREIDHSGWRKLEASVAALVGRAAVISEKKGRPTTREISVCVLPFVNMSGEPEQEYFSDGISEDITTDLSQVSALEVIARNTSFMFKGQSVDVTDVAKQLRVSHVLEGSVRKAGNRVRITAQLIDGQTGGHVWANRYDRDLTDIFAIQDEISRAIVEALQLRLLPREKQAIKSRGTSSVEAYNLYLMAREQWVSGTFGNLSRDEAIVRFCKEATLLDSHYAKAWALMALAQAELRFWHGKEQNALAAANRALALNAELPEAYCVKARYLEDQGRADEAEQQVRKAIQLDPASWEANRETARLLFRHGHIREAIPYFEKAASLMETDWHNPGLLMSCFRSIGDEEGMLRAARIVLERTERAVAADPTNAPALAIGASALAESGQVDRAREWIRRALLLDPDNVSMRYNLVCALVVELRDYDQALDILPPYFEQVSSRSHLRHLEADPDLDPIRDDPRFKEMLASAKKRLGVEKSGR